MRLEWVAGEGGVAEGKKIREGVVVMGDLGLGFLDFSFLGVEGEEEEKKMNNMIFQFRVFFED